MSYLLDPTNGNLVLTATVPNALFGDQTFKIVMPAASLAWYAAKSALLAPSSEPSAPNTSARPK